VHVHYGSTVGRCTAIPSPKHVGGPRPPPAPRLSSASLPDPPCLASTPQLRQTLSEYLLVSRAAVAHHRPRHRARRARTAAPERARAALDARCDRAYGPARRRFGSHGCVTKPACSHGVGRAQGRPHAVCVGPCVGNQPSGRDSIEIPFSYLIQLKFKLSKFISI
jgi:hypothetical protein